MKKIVIMVIMGVMAIFARGEDLWVQIGNLSEQIASKTNNVSTTAEKKKILKTANRAKKISETLKKLAPNIDDENVVEIIDQDPEPIGYARPNCIGYVNEEKKRTADAVEAAAQFAYSRMNKKQKGRFEWKRMKFYQKNGWVSP